MAVVTREDSYKNEKKRLREDDSIRTRFKDGIDDSFRIYMHRKVELQRKQFGLVVPPPPSFKPEPTDSILDDKDKDKDSERGKCPIDSSIDSASLEKGHETSNNKDKRKDLFFAGVVVIVNGYTNPDAPTIMRLMHKHGGDLEKYETHRITHIIAEHLSVAKANIYKKQRNPTPVVYPSWITDSVAQGKILPHGDYLLNEVKDRNSCGLKKSFFPNAKQDTKTSSNDSIIATATSTSTAKIQSNQIDSSHHKIRTVGTDPNFLESYFSTSRLSFIGSYKQRSNYTSSNTSSSRSNIDNSNSTRTFQNPSEITIKFIFHVDMDCFFASVALRNYPQYQQSPVAIGHNNIMSHHRKNANKNSIENANNISCDNDVASKRSTSELSTCNYIARQYGVKKGMWLDQAKLLCPNLIVLPYDYDGYDEVTNQVAEILFSYSNVYNGSVELVSCDEAYLELWIPDPNETKTGCFKNEENPTTTLSGFTKSIAEQIRRDIYSQTKCTASIGCSKNKFLAKLATDKAKPDGSKVIIADEWRDFLKSLKLRDLPGIGYKLEKKLTSHQIITVQDVWDLEDDAENIICPIVGRGNGKKLIQFCNGKDSRAVASAPRKTIGAEVSSIYLFFTICLNNNELYLTEVLIFLIQLYFIV